MQIRQAQHSDKQDIEACAVAAYAMYVDRMGRKPAPMVADFEAQIEAGIVHVLIDDADSLAGFVVIFAKGDCLFLENIAVFPAEQGKGVGAALMSFCQAEAQRRGLGGIELYTNEKMTENLTLYPRIGFVETERRREDGFNRVYFRKAVPPRRD